MTTATAPRRRLSASERRQRIEAAAVEAFADRGYDATTLAEISRAAGVTRTVLYDHFDSKRDVYLHVLAQQSSAILDDIGAQIASDGVGADRMRATVAAYLSFAHDRPTVWRLLVDPIPTGDADLDTMLDAYRAARTATVAQMLAPDLLRAGAAPGSTEAAVAVELLISGIDGVCRWWQRHPTASLTEVTDIATRLLWNGLPRIGAH